MGNCFGKIMSNVIYFSEKFSMCLSFSLLISCSICCMVCMLAFGVGLGYNYSYVDFKTKHTFIADHYKKIRPTSFYSPGFYRPSTKRKKKITKRVWYNLRAQTQSEEEITAVEVVREVPEELPRLSPDTMVSDMVDVQPQYVFKSEQRLENLYFSSPATKLRLSFSLTTQNESTTEALYYVDNNKNTKVDMYKILEQTGKSFGNSDVNATKPLKESEPITVNVTKTRDAAPPFVLKTMMHQNQLIKWLSRLQDSNKTFAVHVITN